VSFIGKGPIYFVALFIALIFFSLPRAFYYFFVYTFGIALYDIGKNYYAQARPYFVDASIQPLGECTAGFGNPSGHSVMSTQWAILLWLDYFYDRNIKSIWSFLFLGVAITFFGSILYARVYVGVHGINQAVFGSSLGMFLALYSHFLVREPLMGHIERILRSKQRLPLKYILEACLISFIAVAANTFVFIKDIKHFGPIPQEWITNLKNDCHKTFEGELWFKTYSESMRTQITIGAYFGIFFFCNGLGKRASK